MDLQKAGNMKEAFRIRDEAFKDLDMNEVAEWCGIFPNRAHKILCPGHQDSKPSCHIYPDHAFCFVCGYNAGPKQFVMDTMDMDYKEAGDFLAKHAGLPTSEEIIASFKGKKSTPDRRTTPCPFDNEHFQYLGLMPFPDKKRRRRQPSTVLITESLSYDKPKSGLFMASDTYSRKPSDETLWVKMKAIRYTINDLWNADEHHEGFAFMIYGKFMESWKKWYGLWKREIWLQEPFRAKDDSEQELLRQKCCFDAVSHALEMLEDVAKEYHIKVNRVERDPYRSMCTPEEAFMNAFSLLYPEADITMEDVKEVLNASHSKAESVS